MEFQSPLHKKLHDGVFVFTAETTPPDASNKETLLKKINPLKDVADAINVTDSPGAKVHMSALTAAIILAQNDIDPILQLTVRDRNRLAFRVIWLELLHWEFIIFFVYPEMIQKLEINQKQNLLKILIVQL